MPFKVCLYGNCVFSKTVEGIFMKNFKNIKLFWKDAERTLTPHTLFTEFCPFIILNMETGPLFYFKPMQIFSQYI